MTYLHFENSIYIDVVVKYDGTKYFFVPYVNTIDEYLANVEEECPFGFFEDLTFIKVL